jgi:hypothetical protein
VEWEKIGGSMDLVRLSGGLLVKVLFFLNFSICIFSAESKKSSQFHFTTDKEIQPHGRVAWKKMDQQTRKIFESSSLHYR